VGVEVVADGGDELGHGAEHSAADGFFGQLSEPPLDRLSHELEVGVKCKWNLDVWPARP